MTNSFYAAAAASSATAAITFSPPSPAAYYPVTLNATTSGGTAPYSFAWTFGDGINATGNPAIHTFASYGSYNVTVTIKDNTGAISWTYRIINVKLDVVPVPVITWTPPIIFAGETVFFDGSGSLHDPDGVIVAYLWQLGDGASQTGNGVLHTYSSPGVYKVTLSVTDDSGVTRIKSVALWVHPAMALTASSNATQGFAPLGISFNAQVSGGQSPYAFSWDFGDGLTSNHPTPIHNYTIPRVYRDRLARARCLAEHHHNSHGSASRTRLLGSLRGHPQGGRRTHGNERAPSDDLHDRTPSKPRGRDFLRQSGFTVTGRTGLSAKGSHCSYKQDMVYGLRQQRDQSTWEPNPEF
jgi:PKD repeat protein